MCGIVAGIAERNVTPILLEGLRRLEYHGYDSTGIALLDADGVRALGKVKARGGQMIVFEDELSDISSEDGFRVIKAATNVRRITAPITYNILLQLLSNHVALIKGTDVDQSRNLAKSVTVE